MQGAVIFPIVYQGGEAFLLFGLPDRREWDIKEVITQLDIY
jgi:hypothetical protein